MRPCRGRILVKPVEAQDTLNGGKIILTQNVVEVWVQGQFEIVAVGEPTICENEDCERNHVWRNLSVPVPPSGSHGGPRNTWISGELLAREMGYDLPSTDLVHPLDERLIPGAWILAKPRTAIDAGERDLYFLGVEDCVAVFEP